MKVDALEDFFEAIRSAGICEEDVKEIMDARNLTVTFKGGSEEWGK